MSPVKPPPILYLVLILMGLGAAYFYYFRRTPQTSLPSAPSPEPNLVPSPGIETPLPNPVVLTMDGSVTMVRLIKMLQNSYAQLYPNTPTTYGLPEGKPNGSSQGLEALIRGTVHLAATSRPLKPSEAGAGIQVIPIAKDAVAVVVGKENPYSRGLSLQELADIYQGNMTNWAQLGGPPRPIRVLNRSRDSGTRDLFQSIVLLDQPFAPDGGNFITFERDVTTPILRALREDGIGYTTVAQAVNQQTVRILAIEGILPTDRAAVQEGTYPISRSVFLAFPQPTSSAVGQFVGLALSPEGQRLAERAGFIPLY